MLYFPVKISDFYYQIHVKVVGGGSYQRLSTENGYVLLKSWRIWSRTNPQKCHIGHLLAG